MHPEKDHKAKQLEGIRRRQSQGKHFGRPPKANAVAVVNRLAFLFAGIPVEDDEGLQEAMKKVCREFGIAPKTVWTYYRKLRPKKPTKRQLGNRVFELCEHFFGRMAIYGPTDTNWVRWFRSGRTRNDWGVFRRHPITKRIRVELAAYYDVSLRKVPGFDRKYASTNPVPTSWLEWLNVEIKDYVIEREAAKRYGVRRRKKFLAAKAAAEKPAKRQPFEIEVRDFGWLRKLGIDLIEVEDSAQQAASKVRLSLSNFDGLDQIAKGKPRR